MAERPAGGAVLILEDDPGIAALERRRLERAGYRVAVAADTAEARTALRSGGYDLMLLDNKLGGEDSGLDFYLGLREAGCAIPSILVTGFGDEGTLTQALRAGLRDFIPKTPDYLDFLVPTVDRVREQVRTEQALQHERSARAEAEAQQAALAESDRRKDEFLATLAHELRNPLAAIAGAVEVLHRDPSPEEQRWAREVGARQVQHLSHLIDDLLDLSRINLGKIALRGEPTDLAAAVEHAAEVARPAMEARHHAFEVAIRDRPLPVVGDATRLEQVLSNLLTNAAKYTDEGGHVRLEARRDGDEVVVTIADTGIGIPREMQARVFEPFAQMEHATHRSQGGLGIGLALVRKLVALHGGSVGVRGRDDGRRGSVFAVRLPATSAAALAPAPAPPPKAPARRRPLRVLVVDDNADTARALCRVLRSAGHDVRHAPDGPSALGQAADFRPDAVLLDIGLPGGLDGYEVARRLRAMPGLGRAALVATSGYGQESDRRRSSEAGCRNHLVKPIDLDQLLAILDDLGGSAATPAPS